MSKGKDKSDYLVEECNYRLAKRTASTFFHHTAKLKENVESIDPKDQKQMLQGMYIAAIEPLFSPTAVYRRAALDREGWNGLYEKVPFPYWHRTQVSECLIQYWDSIAYSLGVSDSLTRQRFYVLVPMCGCSRDLVWLYKQGVFVTGVDFAENTIKKLKDNNPDIGLHVSYLPSGTRVGTTKDRRLRIFECNFFTCPDYLDHQYNFVWDRCAFSCVNVELRKAYVRQLMYCRAESFCMLIETYEYDPMLFSLPPHPAFPAEILELLGRHLRTENVSLTSAHVDWKAASASDGYRSTFDRQTLHRKDEELTVTVQLTLLCNEPLSSGKVAAANRI